jgi:hypothetical protein
MSISIANLASSIKYQDLRRLMIGLRCLGIKVYSNATNLIVLSDDFTTDKEGALAVINVKYILEHSSLLDGPYSLISIVMREIISVLADPNASNWTATPKGMVANDPVAPVYGETEQKLQRMGVKIQIPKTVSSYTDGSLDTNSYLSTGYQIRINSLGAPEIDIGVDVPEWVRTLIIKNFRTQLRTKGQAANIVYTNDSTELSSDVTLIEQASTSKKTRMSRFFRKL